MVDILCSAIFLPLSINFHYVPEIKRRDALLLINKCHLLSSCDQLYEVIKSEASANYSIELFHQPTLMHNFLYSLTICLLHYYPRHISSINMPIFRRKYCIHSASGIFALCKGLPSTLVESGESALNQCTGLTFAESEDTRCCVNTIFPPEDGHVNARNMSRIIM